MRKNRTRRTLLLTAISVLVMSLFDPAAEASSHVYVEPTGVSVPGAYGEVTIYKASDGGLYGYGYVEDTEPDGRCAHVRLRWRHWNGEYYYDSGLWKCGAGTWTTKTWGARNPNSYWEIAMQVWRDGDRMETVWLWRYV